MEGRSPAAGSGAPSRFCVSLWEGEEALTLSDIEKCTCASACASDDRSVLDGGAGPMMQTRCAGEGDYCTNRSENEHSGMQTCRCVHFGPTTFGRA